MERRAATPGTTCDQPEGWKNEQKGKRDERGERKWERNEVERKEQIGNMLQPSQEKKGDGT